MFKKLSIKSQIATGFLLIALIPVIIGVLGSVSIGRIKGSMTSLKETEILIRAAMKMKLAVDKNLQIVMELLESRQENELEKFWSNNKKWVSNFNTFKNAVLIGGNTEEGIIYATNNKKIRFLIKEVGRFYSEDFIPIIIKIYTYKKNIFKGMKAGKSIDIYDIEMVIATLDLDDEASDIGDKMLYMVEIVNDELNDELLQVYSETDKIVSIIRFEFIVGVAAGVILIIIFAIFLTKSISKPIYMAVKFADSIADGDYSITSDIKGAREIESLGNAMNAMKANLQQFSNEQDRRLWLADSKAELRKTLRGTNDMQMLITKVITALAHILKADIGAFYLAEKDKLLTLKSGYALSDREHSFNKVAIGEGLIGQAALGKESVLLTNIPKDSLTVNFGIGEFLPSSLIIVPVYYTEKLKGVLLLGAVKEFSATEQEFADQISTDVGIAINNAESREKIEILFNETKEQSSRLEIQQDKLLNANVELEKKAEDLENASRYKSEFLANMSHELRTPLNSLLILARIYADNEEGNLTPEQIESAEIMYNSGSDLLTMINEILDLSKVEAGKMRVTIEDLSIKELVADISGVFNPVAKKKNILFAVNIADNLPGQIRTDGQKLSQILKNLLSNAFKFTSQGGVTLAVNGGSEGKIVFSVSDTGSGIPEEKQTMIFEAFQQADGSTSRKYGGTGLGLSISKEFTRILEGKITLESKKDIGSTFILCLPEILSKNDIPDKTDLIQSTDSKQIYKGLAISKTRKMLHTKIEDDRNTIFSKDKLLLIVEDNSAFAKILFDMAHRKGFKVLVAGDGDVAMEMAKEFLPKAIILDIMLPVVDGWVVMNKLKNDPATRHIPVYFISALDEDHAAMNTGAIGYLSKPANKQQLNDVFKKIKQSISGKVKNLLLVESDLDKAKEIITILKSKNINITHEKTDGFVSKDLKSQCFDCLIIGSAASDSSTFEMLKGIGNSEVLKTIPIIIYISKELSFNEEKKLKQFGEGLILKIVKSLDRLIDEATLFLHENIENIPETQKNKINMLHNKDSLLKNKKVLIVDDDMRNTFAISKVLKKNGMKVIMAENGSVGLKRLNSDPDCDFVLMDIMMPIMDGYEAIKKIREQERFKKLPVLALTAMAMKSDKDKCMDAGADDYVTKPVDSEILISIMMKLIKQ